MASLMPVAKQQYFIPGTTIPLIGGKLYTYTAGTSTPKATWQDAAGTIQNTNPITLDSTGSALIFWSGNYKVVLKDALGNTIYTVDNYNTDPIGVAAFISDVASSTGSSLIGFLQSGAGTSSRTVQDELRDTINAKQFGMSTTANAAANTAALLAAITEAAARTNGVVEIPPGTYPLTAGTNFARAGVAIIGRGKVIFDFSAGAGLGFVLDSGGSGALVQRMRVENLFIKGGPAITEAYYQRGIVRSMFRNIEVKEATTSGFALRFSVLNTYDHCLISDDTGLMTTRPTNYWYLDDDGAVGNHTQANLFLNCEASGQGAGSTKTGWNLTNAILNKWVGGTAESCNIGIDITSDVCRMNSWEGFDMEDNQTYDARLKGISNDFYTSFAQSAGGSVVDNISISTGVNCKFFGGYYRKVNCGIGSANTGFFGATLDDNAALGIQGPGTFRRYGCTTNTGGVGGALTGVLRDVLGASVATTLSLSQNNTPAQTVAKNEATVSGRIVQMRGQITANAAGTAGNSIAVSLDSTFPAKSTSIGLPCGTFMLVTAGGTIYTGIAVLNTASVLVFRTNASTGNLGINPAVTLGAGDVFSFNVEYPLE